MVSCPRRLESLHHHWVSLWPPQGDMRWPSGLGQSTSSTAHLPTSAKHIIYTSCFTCSPWWWYSLVKTRGRNIKLICVLCDRLCNVMYDVRHTLTNILWGRQLTIPQHISSCVTYKTMKLKHYQVIQITFSSQMLRAWLTEMLSYIFSWYGTQNGGFREKFLICSHNSLQQEIHDMVQPN